MLVDIEFVDGKIRDYDVDIEYTNRVISIIKETKGHEERIGIIPFEAVMAVRFKKEGI